MRQTLGIFIGMISGFIVILFSQYLSSLLFGNPSQQVVGNKILMSEYIKSLPIEAFMILISGYILGSFLAGIISSSIDKKSSYLNALICGLLLNIAGVYNVFLFEHPLWFVIINFIVYLPFAFLGYLISKKF